MLRSITAGSEITKTLFQRKNLLFNSHFCLASAYRPLQIQTFKYGDTLLFDSVFWILRMCVCAFNMKAGEMRTRDKSLSINSPGLLPQALDQSERNSYKWCIVKIISCEFSPEPFDLYTDHTHSQDVPFDEWHLIYMYEYLMLYGERERCSHFVSPWIFQW